MRLFGKVAEFSAAFALFVLVVVTIGAVFMRYFIGQPLQWTEEMSGMLMIWVVMLGGVVAERDRAHLTIPFLMEMLPGKLRRVIAVLVALLSIALLLYMAWLGYRLAEMAQFKVTQILKVSWFWIDLAVPVGALATAIYTLYWLINDTKQSDSGRQNAMSWLLIIPLMIVCLFLNIRVYLAMFIGIIAYFLFFSSVPIEIAVQRLIAPTQSPSLLAIPFFILLGTLMSYTGIAERILHIANVLVGKMRGGLGVANILVSTMMGGVSASNLADAAMLSRMMVPEMERKGYNRAFAAAITAGGSLVTPIIPPGIALIIYGLVADVSIGKMFIAGLVPGLLCAVVLMFTVYLVARKTNAKPSRESWPTGKEMVFSLGQAWPALFLIFAVVGGIRANIFTPTEAGAVAVLIVLAIGFFIYREMRISHVVKALGETARATASVMLVIMASAALGWIFSMEHAGVAVANFVTSLTENKYMFLLIINILLLTLGMFLEGNAILLILVPLLKPVVEHFGIDPVHFGIIMIFNLSIGAFTPPVGTVMLLVCNITQVSVGNFFKQSLPLLAALLLMLMLVTYIPAISLFLV